MVRILIRAFCIIIQVLGCSRSHCSIWFDHGRASRLLGKDRYRDRLELSGGKGLSIWNFFIHPVTIYKPIPRSQCPPSLVPFRSFPYISTCLLCNSGKHDQTFIDRISHSKAMETQISSFFEFFDVCLGKMFQINIKDFFIVSCHCPIANSTNAYSINFSLQIISSLRASKALSKAP